MKRLKNILQSKYLYYYFLAVFIFFLSLNYPLFFLLLILYLIKFRKSYNKVILLIILFLSLLIYLKELNIKVPNNISNEFLIVDKIKYDNNFKYTIKHKNYKYTLYHKDNFKIGSYIYINGKINEIRNYKTPNSFNYHKYYKSIGIYGEIEYNYIKIIDNKYNYLYYFSNKLTFLDNTKIEDTLSDLNLYYLISISGIHIYLLIKLIQKLMFHLDIKTFYQDIITILLITFILMGSNYSITVFRIYIYLILKLIKKYYYNNVTNYSLLQLSYYLLILFMPYLLFSKSLLISYIINNILFLFSSLLDSDNKLISSLKRALLINLILVPFNNSINPITIILNPFVTVIYLYLYFPLLLINNFLNLSIIEKMLNINDFLILNLNKIKFKISIPYLNPYLIFIFYSLLILFILSKKYIVKFNLFFLIILLIIIPTFKKNINTNRLYFLDVGQGDSSVYISKNTVIVIDAYRNIASFLKYEGIITIDYLILTHSHEDHTKEASDLINNFNVKNIIVSEYDSNYNVNYSNIIKAKSGMNIYINEVIIKFLGPIKRYSSVNDNSLVFILEYDNNKILYTGDIEYNAEIDIVYNTKNLNNIDILKVAHHGSETSSSIEFLNHFNPKYAIISSKLNNSYNFPNEITLNKLSSFGIKVYRTDLDGTILYKNNLIYLI